MIAPFLEHRAIYYDNLFYTYFDQLRLKLQVEGLKIKPINYFVLNLSFQINSRVLYWHSCSYTDLYSALSNYEASVHCGKIDKFIPW